MTTYELIKVGLDATNLRSKTIANNIANINTAGYKRRYVEFEENLKRAEVKFEEMVDKKSKIRLDGNNIDIEKEKVDQAETSLQYNALVTLANNKISMTRSVITGG